MKIKYSSSLVGACLYVSLVMASLAEPAPHFPSYTSLVPMSNFDKSVPAHEQRFFSFAESVSEIRLSNRKKQHVIFRLDAKNRVIPFHGGTAFLMYEFWEDKTYFSRGYNDMGPRNILKRLTYYDLQGRLKGLGESEEVARYEFEVRNVQIFEASMNKIDEQDGNLDLEDADEKNIILSYFDVKNRLIGTTPVSTREFWGFQHFLDGRP